MTPRQARRERREAERKAKKLELKKSHLAENEPLAELAAENASMRPTKLESDSPHLDAERYPEIQPRWNPELEDEFPREVQIRNNAILDRHSLELGFPIPPPGPCRTSIGFVSQKRAAANRANAQLSTGPRSPQGKQSSSRNSTRHGLASGQLIIPGEDPVEFEALLTALLNDQQPVGDAEELLVQQMAQCHWLAQRALRLQNSCFTEEGVDQKGLALYLRYFTTHNRAFHKALADLQRTQKERKRQERGFVSQNESSIDKPASFRKRPLVDPAQPSRDHKEAVTQAGFVSQTEPTTAAERTQTRKEAA